MPRRLAAALLVLAGCAWLGADVARACGDKFLIIGSGPAVPRLYASIHPATILVVKRSGDLAINSPVLVSSFNRAGHTMKVIDSRNALAQALAKTKFDVVLADLADAKAIDSQVHEANGRPVLVPVLSDPTAAQTAAASKEYACLLKAPEKVTNFLKVVDDLLSERIAARASASNPAARKN